jgi:glycosyltransferase involved in cell wall biosynthesis
MLKLLLIAPACDGQDVGEALSSFQWVRRLASRHDVTVLTYHKQGRTPLSVQLPGVRIVEWPEPPALGRAERLNSMLKPAYVPFYYRARRWARSALARGERFDLAHQLVPVAMRYPSPAAGLGIPFVIGPVGGALRSPAGFGAEERTSAWYVGLRGLDLLRLRRDPWLRATYRRADCVLGLAPYVADLLAPVRVRRFEVMLGPGIDRMPEPQHRVPGGREALPEDRPVRLLFVGRVVRTKGLRDAIRALGLVRALPAVLDVVGDGFDRAECEQLTGRLGLAGRVRFHGWLPRPEVMGFYRSCDVFVFPSYREPAGGAALEAMSHGLPLLVSDRGGPAHLVDNTCGLTVSPRTPHQYASDLASKLAQLITDPTLRTTLGEAARRKAAQIGLWDSKAARLDQLYAEVLAASPTPSPSPARSATRR